MSKPNYGILHNHTEFSVRDSAMSMKAMFERAKDLGATAIALTDHGILTGYYDFMSTAKEYGIKPIPGIEAYYIPNAATDAGMKSMHLILMAKDQQGFQAICDADALSYANMRTEGNTRIPRMDMAILKRCFGPGSSGHGHVIATTACIAGPLSRTLLSNDSIQHAVDLIVNRQEKYHPVDDDLLNAVKVEDDLSQNINELIAQREKLTEKSKVQVGGLKRRLKTLDATSSEYAELSSQIEAMEKAKAQVKEDLIPLKREIANAKRKKTEYSQSIKKMKESAEKWASLEEQKADLMAKMAPDSQLYDEAVKMAREFETIFGENHFFIELQYHRIDTEAHVMPLLAKIAEETGIPTVAANDAHYASNSYEDVRARTLVAALRFNNIDEGGQGFGELYMKSEDELHDILCEILDEDTVNTALNGIRTIIDQCDVQTRDGTHYPTFVGGIPGETTAQRLRRLAEEGIPKRYPGTAWKPEYRERLEYELSVIEKMGFTDYHCIVQDYLAYGRSLATQNPEGVGYTIGPGRGSAVGSLVCYLIGITSVDPMKYGLLFERFLNPERVSMPDIDSDFHTKLRSKVVDYVREKYRVGTKDGQPICGIITKGTLAARAAIRAVGRVTDIPASIVDSLAKMVPKEPDTKIDDIPNLQDLCDGNPVIARLISDAKLIEGTATNYGMHAAGIIIADNGNVGQYVPLMYNEEKEMWVAQCEMSHVEGAVGLLKMDFLGLNNLDIITDTLQRIYRNYGVRIDIEKVPLEPAVFSNIFAAGNTDCVFQFESDGMKKMLRQFKPSSMEDLILLNAAYRPGPIQYIPDITAVKNGRKKPHYICAGLEEIFGQTYGSPIYQEQIMQLFHSVAGCSLGEADIIRRAMSKKKLKVLTDPKTNYQGRLVDGLMARGASREEAEALWEQLLNFASYAFNKSHAAAYAHVAYYTAWLKYHYPAEYMCSVITRTDFKKLPTLINVCKHIGLTIKRPDINQSSTEFISTTDSAIIFGFGNIKGVGNAGADIVAERNEHGQFSSVKDFVTRMLQYRPQAYKKDVMTALVTSGAFDDFCSGNRASILGTVEEFADTTKKKLAKQADVNRKQVIVDTLQASPIPDEDAIKKAERSLSTAQKSLANLSELCVQHTFPLVQDNIEEKLKSEYELLGFYISGTPFDKYIDAAAKIRNRVPLSDVTACERDSNVTICGIVQNLQMFVRKADSMPFCGFTLIDETSEIAVKCFTAAYQACQDMIHEDTALTIKGILRVDAGTQDDGTEIVYGYYVAVQQITVLIPSHDDSIIISGASLIDWVENCDAIQKYEDPNGYELYFNDRLLRQVRKAEFRVSGNILNASFKGLLISKNKNHL